MTDLRGSPTVASVDAPLRTIADLLPTAVSRYENAPALRFKEDGLWHDLSYTDLASVVDAIALGLIRRGVGVGDRVGLLGESCVDWTLCDLAVVAAGGVTVPVYPTSTVGEVEWVLGNSEATFLIGQDDAQLEKAAHARLPHLRERVVFAGTTADSLDVLRSEGGEHDTAELRRRREAVAPGDLLTIIYTSGTTGPPKGCMWTHANLAVLMDMFGTVMDPAEGDVFYLHLPLAHANSRLGQFLNLLRGVTIAYPSRPYREILDDLAEVRPTILASVPRTWEKAFASATTGHSRPEIAEATATAHEIARLEDAHQTVPEELRRRADEWEATLFRPARAVLGGRVRMANTGAAPIAIEVLEFFRAAGIPIFEGYGLTETTCVASGSTPEEHRVGSVGRMLPGMTARIADDGEILVSGPNIFPGYYRDPDATAAVLRDGWLHTGDLGEIDADGFLYITGRKKELIISSAGKNIAPANVENELTRSPLISNAIVYGDRKPYCVALFTLDEKEAQALIERRGRAAEAALADDPDVLAALDAVVSEVNEKVAPPFRVRRFAVLGRELRTDAGELTPTHKLRRAAVYDNHRALFESLYEGAS